MLGGGAVRGWILAPAGHGEASKAGTHPHWPACAGPVASYQGAIRYSWLQNFSEVLFASHLHTGVLIWATRVFSSTHHLSLTVLETLQWARGSCLPTRASWGVTLSAPEPPSADFYPTPTPESSCAITVPCHSEGP